MTQRLTKKAVLNGLNTKRFGRHLYVFDELDSTNACARTLAATGSPEGATVAAEYQTAGRGRLGRAWTSEPGQNLLFSVILRPGTNHQLATLSYIVGIAIATGIESATGLRTSVKWPNDIQIDGKKVCGILLEQEGSGADVGIVAGIGINVNQDAFSPELAERATSLSLASGHPVDRLTVLRSALESLERIYDQAAGPGESSVLRLWSDRCITLGKKVTVEHGSQRVTGIAVGLSTDGGLELEHAGRTTTVYAGDSTILT